MQTTIETVEQIKKEYADLQILQVSNSAYPAICYKNLVGPCYVGDTVKLNIEATQRKLGTGGYDFVISKLNFASNNYNGGVIENDNSENYENDEIAASQSKIMKLRYTPLQCCVDTIEDEHSPLHNKLRDVTCINKMPVACCGLHSQVPLVAAGIKKQNPHAKIVYCMTDEASLMLPFSNIARQCKENGLIDSTITCGQATGGDYEAVSLHSGLAGAYAGLDADAVIVAIGPGVAGTSTALGNGGCAQAQSINAVAALGGTPVAVMRVSFADKRARHNGVSHHFLISLGQLALARAYICYPAQMQQLDKDLQNIILEQLNKYNILDKHNLIAVDMEMGIDVNEACELASTIDTCGIKVTTMGRDFGQDPWYFLTAYSAGLHIGRHIQNPNKEAFF